MFDAMSHKVTDSHRQRDACLYIRQSSVHQVLEHTESAHRQYGLRQRALALGWRAQQLQTIDEDQGKSGAHSANRSGFRDLMARIAAGEVGIVLSLEVSRLCRNNSDWHQLLQIAAIADTLILDEVGVYDPNDGNDRLLLGLKGALSEYELQGIRARLIGGQRSKAQRGELKMRLPIGLNYSECDEVVLDPDRSIVESIDLVFSTFRRLGSATQTLKWFRKNALPLPSRPYHKQGETHWSVPNHSQIIRMLRNPRYAGCFAYGRTHTKKRADGSVRHSKKAMEDWQVCIPNAHVGYINWDDFRRNQQTLDNNRAAFPAANAHQRTPRQGSALLQSRIICGHCGHRMRVRYTNARPQRNQPARWYYFCQQNVVRHGERTCQSMRGDPIDTAVSLFVISAVNQDNIALTILVREQLQADFAAADQQRANQIEKLHDDAQLARRRFMEVDPSNRLVAATLEAEWNASLEAFEQAVAERQRYASTHATEVSAEQDERLRELASDFGKVWNAPHIDRTDRKRLLALIIEDVTLTREAYQVRVQLRLRGGRISTLEPVELPRPRAIVVRHDVSDSVLSELLELFCSGCSDITAAEALNQRGLVDSRGDSFTRQTVRTIRLRQGWPNMIDRQRDQLRGCGYMNVAEIGRQMGISAETVRRRVNGANSIERRQFQVGRRLYSMYKPMAASDVKSNQTATSSPETATNTHLPPSVEQFAL